MTSDREPSTFRDFSSTAYCNILNALSGLGAGFPPGSPCPTGVDDGEWAEGFLRRKKELVDSSRKGSIFRPEWLPSQSESPCCHLRFTAMNLPSNNEFAQYRFVRDARGNVINLPAEGKDEKNFLVLDCERWGLARLRLFEGAAVRPDRLKSFQEDLELAAGIRSPHLSRLLSWGRDGEDLFYAGEMLDGEPLATYLRRSGGVPVGVACEWVLELLHFFESINPMPASLSNFSTLNFDVVMNRDGRISPVFSEFYGWISLDAPLDQPHVVSSFARIFCSLVAGVPISTIHRDALPENLDGLDPAMLDIILRALEEAEGDSDDAFRSVMQSGAVTASDERSRVEVPLMPVREWLRRDLEATGGGAPDYLLEPSFDPTGEPYAIPVQLRGSPTHVQLLPGPGEIPREGWLHQHHAATRRPGRGMLHQLQVNYIEDRDSITLIGEERIDGVDLKSLIAQTGPLSLETAKEMAGSIHAALDALEKQTGACAIWWLPVENVLLVTGTRSLSGSAGLIERKGSGSWASFPLKFRLHQTLPTLKEGVNLPSKVRDLSRSPNKQHECARRSAIALPLLWHLLTGTRFRWSCPVVASDEVPAALAEFFEHCRQQLRSDPTGVPDNFFLTFSQFVLPTTTLTEESVPEEEENGVVEGKDNSLDEVLKSTLYEGDLDLACAPPEPSADELTETIETEAPVIATLPVCEECEPLRKHSSAVIGFWAIVLGVVVASVGGFFLSGWSFQRGLFRETESASFTIPEFRFLEGERREVARSHLENLLVASGDSESLALLPALEHLDLKSNREQIQAWLKTNIASKEGEGFRVLGLLALSRGEVAEVTSGYFLKGAKKGDLESQFRYAVSQWSDKTGLAAGTEALPLLEMAASRGHDASQELLARVKLSLNDAAGARKWAESAARQGRASAVHLLGLFYLKGIGSEADLIEAVVHLRSAAELGDERAMYDYGRCLSEGRGVEPSFTEAQRWMRIAASRGHGAALRWCLDRSLDFNGGVGK